MKLVIAEKAKMARALRDGLNQSFESHIEDKGLTGYYESKDLIITFAMGHLLKMYDIDNYLGEKKPWSMDILPFIPEPFKYKPTDNPAAKKQLGIIKELMHRKDVTEIIHLGDPDREGELLVRLILAYNKNNKPVKRMWCLSIVPEIARDAYHNLQDITETDSWFQEGLARQRIDWLWGINLSRFLSLKSGTLLPVGRVLVPIVKYIYDRDMKIRNFVKEYSWGVEGVFEKDGIEYTLRHKDLIFAPNDKAKAEDTCKKLNGLKGIVQDVKTVQITKQPNKMFSLLKLQSLLNKKYGMSMETSMAAIQNLYLNGYITYPRTPTEYISDKEINNTRKIVDVLIGKGYPLEFHQKKSVFDESKCQGHTAIIITQQLPDTSKLNDTEKKIYTTILNRFVSNFVKEKVVIKETTATINVGEYEYKLTGEELIQEGFLKYEKRPLKPKLASFSKGEQLNITFSVVEKESSPPNKVTVAELNDYLKNPYRDKIKNLNSDDELYKLLSEGCTIGTEATTTQIIENAIKYGYISFNKTTYSIEEKGISLIKILDDLGINLYRDKNVEFNQELKRVYRAETTVPEVIKNNARQITEIINNSKNKKVDNLREAGATGTKPSLGKCPRCSKDIVENSKAFSCIGYRDEPKCNFAIWKNNKLLAASKKKVTVSMVKSLLKKGECVVTGLTSKAGKKYDAVMVLNDTGQYVNLELDFTKKVPPQFKKNYKNK